MWELDCEESWAPKNRCFWTVVLEKTLESPLDCKESQPVHPKGDQFWVFIGRTDAKLKLQYFGHLMWRADSLEKTLMLGGIGGRRRRGRQRIRWLDGITDSMDMGLGGLRVGDGQGGMACCGSWDRKELDTTERLSWTALRGLWKMKGEMVWDDSCGKEWGKVSLRRAYLSEMILRFCWLGELGTGPTSTGSVT